jgi:hypothetical protein
MSNGLAQISQHSSGTDAVGGSTRLSGAVRQILHAYFLTVCADLLTVSDIII